MNEAAASSETTTKGDNVRQVFFNRPLFGIVLLALSLRLTVFFIEPYEPLQGDAIQYFTFAEDLAAGRDYTHGDEARVVPRSSLPPLYPLFITTFLVTVGFLPKLIILVQIVLSLAAILATYYLSRQFVSERLSLFAALLVALHPALALEANRLLTEALYIPLLSIMIVLYWFATSGCLGRYGLLAGVFCGGVMLTRNAAMFLPVALVAGALFVHPNRNGLRLAGAVLLGVVVSLCPWWIHQYSKHGTPWPTQASQGTSMFTSYALAAHHGFMVRPERVPFAYDDPKRANDEYNEKVWKPRHTPGYTPPVTARYFLSHPMDYVRQTWWRLFQFVKPVSCGKAFGFPDGFGEYFRAGRFGILGLKGLLLAFDTVLILSCLAGALLALRKLRMFAPLFMIAGYFLCLHTLVHATSRYRHPLIPLLAIFAVFFFSEVGRWLRNRRQPAKNSQPAIDQRETTLAQY